MEVSALNPTSLPGLRGPSPLLRLQSDEKLITLTRRGQHAAFETLFGRYQSRLLAFCRHMLGSKEDAEDVLQEVFAAAFNAILADERAINVRPWLYRIARNRSLNHLRKATAVGVDSMDIHLAENGLSTGDRVMRRETFRQLITDVGHLPETQRTALLLREIDALSYEQIAHAMETTVPSVKSLLVRARVSLAEAAESRKLSCEEVRVELGEVAEGLLKISSPVRRHVRECERCRSFRKHLKENNLALAAIMPVGPLLILKKLLFAKLGSASAGGAHVAGAGAGAGSATAGAAGGSGAAGGLIGAGAAGGSGAAGSLVTAGAGALATKAVAGLAAAALVTAGAVEANHSAISHHRRSRDAGVAATAGAAQEPVIVRSTPQPSSLAVAQPLPQHAAHAARDGNKRRTAHHPKPLQDPPVSASATPPAPVDPTAADKLVAPKADVAPVTEVTSETTQLPATPAPTVEETVSSTTSTSAAASSTSTTPVTEVTSSSTETTATGESEDGPADEEVTKPNETNEGPGEVPAGVFPKQ